MEQTDGSITDSQLRYASLLGEDKTDPQIIDLDQIACEPALNFAKKNNGNDREIIIEIFFILTVAFVHTSR